MPPVMVGWTCSMQTQPVGHSIPGFEAGLGRSSLAARHEGALQGQDQMDWQTS